MRPTPVRRGILTRIFPNSLPSDTPASTGPKYNIARNPFRAKKTWPPNFDNLSTRHQFALERKFRRRSQLKWLRPTWNKVVTLSMWGSMTFILFYSVFYLDLGTGREAQGEQPFATVRKWYRDWTNSLWTYSSHEASRKGVEEEKKDENWLLKLPPRGSS